MKRKMILEPSYIEDCGECLHAREEDAATIEDLTSYFIQYVCDKTGKKIDIWKGIDKDCPLPNEE